jgi:DoxX-like protein
MVLRMTDHSKETVAPVPSAKTKSPIAYWIFMVPLLLFLLWFGVSDLRRTPDVTAALSHLGYPEYFAYFLGVGKLLAAAAFLYPAAGRWREWAYAGLTAEFVCSFASHSLVGDSWGMRIAPLVILAIMSLAGLFDPHRLRSS